MLRVFKDEVAIAGKISDAKNPQEKVMLCCNETNALDLRTMADFRPGVSHCTSQNCLESILPML